MGGGFLCVDFILFIHYNDNLEDHVEDRDRIFISSDGILTFIPILMFLFDFLISFPSPYL